MARIKLSLPDHLPFATELEVRVNDTNYGGHMGNDALLSLLHEARMRFLGSMGFSEMDVDGAGIIMADSAIEYRSEAFRGETLLIRVGAHDFSRRGCDIVYHVSDKASGREVARAKTGIVFFDYQARKTLPVPAEFLRRCGQDSPKAA